MSWLSKIKGIVLPQKKGLDLSGLTGLFGSGGLWWSMSEVDSDTLMKQARGWVFACISKIAEEVGNMNIRLYRIKGGERKDWEEIEDHPLLDLLNKPNEDMHRFELLQMFSMHDDLTGNAYWYLDGAKNEDQAPTAIYPLNPKHVKVILTKSFPPTVDEFLYTVGSEKRAFARHQIIHFKRPNPNNPFIGLGPTEAALESIDALNWAQEWNKKFFQNSGRPGLVLETDQVDETIIRILRETFEDKYVGAAKAHKTAVLPRGVKIADKGSLSQKDMDFSELLRQMRDAILAHFGVPHVVLGLGAGEALNRATAETTDYIFARRTIQPKDRRFITYLNAYYVPRFGDDLVLDFDDPVPENTEMQVKEDQAALGSAPYKSINEVRAERGLPPITGGDSVMGSNLLTPVGEPSKALKKPERSSKSLSIVPKPRAKQQKERRAGVASEIATSLVNAIKSRKGMKRKDILTEDWATKWDAMVKRVEPKEKDIRKAMADYAEKMTERALSAFNDATKAVTAKDLLDKKDEVAAIIDILDPIFQEILKQEGKTAAEMIDSAFDATDKRTQSSLAKSLKLLSNKYTDETIALLDSALSEGIEAGDSLDDLAKRIQLVGDFSSKSRAETVARTEAFRVANFSTKEAWRQSGVVRSVKWYTAADEAVCPFCGEEDGKIVGIDENFYDKGDTVEGTDTEGQPVSISVDYASVEAPPLHPNCRCYIRPEDISTN